jgi:hypothetical protein
MAATVYKLPEWKIQSASNEREKKMGMSFLYSSEFAGSK